MHALLEVTSPEAALTGMKSCDGSDVITGSMFCACPEVHPHLFSTIVIVQNVPLLLTESSMATGCDLTESDVTGSDIIRSKVGDSPCGMILFVRGVA
jgi:hypothetical protein